MKQVKNIIIIMLSGLIIVALLSSCNSGSSATTSNNNLIENVSTTASYTVEGTASGMAIGQYVTLSDASNAKNSIVISSNGRFTLPQKYPVGSFYNIEISSSSEYGPCSLIDGLGIIKGPVTNIKLVCNFPKGVLGLISNSTQTRKLPEGITITPNGKYAYVVNTGAYTASNTANTISMYAVKSNGALSPLTTKTVSTTNLISHKIVVTPNGKYAYVTNDLGTVSMYSINNNTGVLSLLEPVASVNAASGADEITISSNGNFVYVSNTDDRSISMYTISSNGALTPTTPAKINVNATPKGIAVTPNGKYLYVIGSNNNIVLMYSIDNSTGTLSPLKPASVSAGEGANRIAVTPNGNYAYVTNSIDGTISMYGVSATGILSALPSSPLSLNNGGGEPTGITVSPNGNYAYAISNYGNQIFMFSISSNGTLVAFSNKTISTSSFPQQLIVSPNNSYAYVTNEFNNSVSIYGINN